MTPSLLEGDLRVLGAAAGALLALGLAITVGVVPFMAEGTARQGSELLSLLLLGLGAAGLVVLLLRLEPAWPVSLGVAAMIFSGHWNDAGSPIAFDRALIAIALCSLLLRARSSREFLGREPSGIHLLLICTLLYAFSSAVMAGTLDETGARFALIDKFGVIPFILFAIAPAAFPDARSRRILLGTLTVVGAYLAYTSLLGKLGPQALVFPGYITDPFVGIHADRARGPFVGAGPNGLALFECGVAAAVLYAGELDRRIRLAAVIIVGACGLSILLTLTRSVWLGSALALAITILVTRETRRYFVPVLVGGVLAVVGAFAVIPGLEREADERTSDQEPVWDRKNTNAASLRMVEDRPLLGFGWATFERASDGYIRLADDYPVTRGDLAEHNVFLSNAAELGLIGLTLWGAAWAWAIGGAILRRGPPELYWWKIGLIAIAVQWFVVANFSPLGYAFPNALLWLWAGLAWGPSTAPDATTARIPVAPTPKSLPAR